LSIRQTEDVGAGFERPGDGSLGDLAQVGLHFEKAFSIGFMSGL
jgi:hypothetical protein